ncbi:hypothetical protein [Chryseobacterium indoltheticum]|uniref:hypothetical protein n=1 Tax=Chryseobacterium indoltheticum TaxID=254 RepID=UPI003F491854
MTLLNHLFFYEYEDFIFVHAGIDLSLDNPLNDTNSLLWIRDMSLKDYKDSVFSDKKIIHGHTPIEKNKILESFSNIQILNLDNGVYLEKRKLW